MSDNQIEKLLQRIAVLEQAAAEAKKPAPPQEFNHADVVDALTKQGADIDFVTKVLVARAMGDQAPAELRALAGMGPQVAATRALEAKLENLSRQVSEQAAASTKKATRESFRALTSDKTKYPALAKALEADPDFFNEELESLSGSAEDFAAKMEARLKKLVPVEAPPPASEEDADTELADSALGLPGVMSEDDDQSTQVESALGEPETPPAPPSAPKRVATNSRMPPLHQPKPGVFTPDEHERLKAEVVRKYSGRQ